MVKFKSNPSWGIQKVPEGCHLRYYLRYDPQHFLSDKKRKDGTINPKFDYPVVYQMQRKVVTEGGVVDGIRRRPLAHYETFYIGKEDFDDYQHGEFTSQPHLDKWSDVSYIREVYTAPCKVQKEWLVKNTAWVPDEWFPAIGRTNQSFSTRDGRNYDTVVDMWGDEIEGHWVSIDELTEWGSKGKRQHPSKLNTPEKLQKWCDWTNKVLMEKCIATNGRMYMMHEAKKGWNVKAKDWSGTVDKYGRPAKKGGSSTYPNAYMFDFSSLRPMVAIEGILQVQTSESEGWYGYGGTKTTRGLRWGVRFKNKVVHIKAGERYYNESGTGWTSKEEDWTTEEPLFFDEPFMRCYKMWHPGRDKYLTAKGYEVQVLCHPSNEYLADKIAEPHYRDLVKVWLPDKPMDFKWFQLGGVNTTPPISAQSDWRNTPS